MIQNQTARRLMYEWHGGQGSPLYAASSSGLVQSFSMLADEITRIGEPDRSKLMAWVMRRQASAPEVIVDGRAYRVLPWVSRSYFPKRSR